MQKNTYKTKKTYKAAAKDCTKIISASYCSMQNLLRYQEPVTYCVGVYGWGCDNYTVDGVLISTGYRPIRGLNESQDVCALVNEYEAKAEHIIYATNETHENKIKAVNALLEEFVTKA